MIEGRSAGDGRAGPEAPRAEKTLERRIRAFHWVRLISAVPERCAGSPGEREAGERVAAWLRELGFEDVTQRDVAAGPDPARSIALHLAVGALGGLLGGLGGTVVAGIALYSFRLDQRAGPGLLSRGLRGATSCSVEARAGASRPRRRVVLSASLDAPRTRGALARRLRRALAFWQSGVVSPARLCERGLQAATLVAVASLLGGEGSLLLAAQLGLTVALGLGVVAAIETGFASATPGANDDASGIAALLTCTEQLLPQLRDDVEIHVVTGGAGNAGAAGLSEVLDRHPEWRSDRCVLLHFDRVGGGALHYLRSETATARTEYPPRLRELARRLAEGGAYREITQTDLVGETAARRAAARGLHALALVSLEPGGVPRGDADAGDVPESLDMEVVVRAADFASAIVVAGWRGESDPLAIV